MANVSNNETTTMQLPTVRSYGEYKGRGNYGAHSLALRFSNGFELFYSYETIVAFNGRAGLKVRKNDWGPTTGKHLNWIDGGDSKARLDGEAFEALLAAELEHYGLNN